MLKNSKIWYFSLSTSLPTFFTSAYSFAMLLIVYQLTNSLFYSGIVTMITIIFSRLFMFLTIPYLKNYEHKSIVLFGFLTLIISNLFFMLFYGIGKNSIFYYITISVFYSISQELIMSYSRPLIQKLFLEEELFKVNSWISVIMNVVTLLGPFSGYIFYQTSIKWLFIGLFVTACFSLWLFYKKINVVMKSTNMPEKMSFWHEWGKVYILIKTNSQILFCIILALLINLIFIGLTTSGILAIGNTEEESMILRTIMGLGTILGILFVGRVNMKNNYETYLNTSILGIFLSLLICYFFNTSFIIQSIAIFFLVAFIMFVMNATGTLLQVITPIGEITSVYEVRSTLLAIIVPLSQAMTGYLLEKVTTTTYFGYMIILISMLILSRLYNQYVRDIFHNKSSQKNP